MLVNFGMLKMIFRHNKQLTPDQQNFLSSEFIIIFNNGRPTLAKDQSISPAEMLRRIKYSDHMNEMADQQTATMIRTILTVSQPHQRNNSEMTFPYEDHSSNSMTHEQLTSKGISDQSSQNRTLNKAY